MLGDPQYLSNLKILKDVTITPVVQDEDDQVISKLKKLPNITFTCYKPEPVFKVPEPPKPIENHSINGLTNRPNNNIISINQVINNVNVKKRKTHLNNKQTPENYPGKENNQTAENNYNEQLFYSSNAKKPKTINIKQEYETIDLTNCDNENVCNDFGMHKTKYKNEYLKTNQNNKADNNVTKSSSTILEEYLLLQEMNTFCDNLIQKKSEIPESPKLIKNNFGQTLKQKYNDSPFVINNSDKTITSSLDVVPEQYQSINNNQQTGSLCDEKSETVSKNTLTNLKSKTSVSKVEKSAISEDYILMDISTYGQANIVQATPLVDLLNASDPGYVDSITDFGQLENSNVHSNILNPMAEDTYNVVNDSRLLQRVTRLFCDNLFETKSETETVMLINDF